MKPLILIVEDEEPLAELLRYNLEKEGFRSKVATTGEEALARLDVELPDLAIVDWMLPERSGIEVCRTIRVRQDTRTLPIIMLTARGEEGDRVLGMEAGADDYVVKPYSPREMVARVNALLRRSNNPNSEHSMEYAGVFVDIEAYKVTRDGLPVFLSPTGFKILTTLMERPGLVYSRDRLLAVSYTHLRAHET